MTTYLDTGLLVKGYVLETGSPEAVRMVEMAGDPVFFSHLHALEVPNAIRLKRFRREISPAQEKAALQALAADQAAGRLDQPRYDLGAAFRKAGELTRFSSDLGTRSLDILHVAIALVARCTVFGSLDHRQRRLAAAAGLKVIPRRVAGG